MTLIVGILCTNGVVMGADGAATLGDSRQPTVRQKIKKISIINNEAIFGTSGQIGLAQQFIWEIKHKWKKEEKEVPFYRRHGKEKCLKDPEEIEELLAEAFLPHIQHRVKAATSTFGESVDAIGESLMAMPFGDKPYLFQFNKQTSSEMSSEDLPFVTIGSGRLIADTFLAFLKDVFWKNRQPTLSDARFATLWTLEHAIENAPAYLGEPPQLVVLEKNDGWRARELSKEELEEHRMHIDAAKDALRVYKESFKEEEEVTLPPKPKPQE